MIRYLLLLPASLAMTLLALLLAPVLPLFADRNGWLPWRLSWFQTPDNSLWGDEGHIVRWGGRRSYWRMVAWLLRNPAYGFEWDGPLAARCAPLSVVKVWGNPWIKNRTAAIAGWYFCRVGPYWNFKAVIPLFGDLAFMPEFGWKLQELAQGRKINGKAMYVFSLRLTAFNPL